MAQILLIDDDHNICLLLERILKRQGHEVVCARSGEEGVIKAQQLHPALIICDWVMSGMSGLEVCRQIKSVPKLATTFFILLTSLGSVEDRVKGLDVGADDFLCKPSEMNEFIARIRAGLRLHQLVLYLLDVSGHGLGAALPALAVINLLRSQNLGQVNYYRPNEVLNGLNKTFQMSDYNDKYFTIWYGVYNCKNRQLIYSSAGHPPAILLTPTPDEKLIETQLKTPGLPVGMFPGDLSIIEVSFMEN